MKRIHYKGKDDFYYEEIEKRKCSAEEIEIKPLILGLCGSDIHKFLRQSPDSNYLLTPVLGHEICGEVTNVGSKIKHVKKGDIVVVNPFNIPEDLDICDSFSLVDQPVDIVGRNIDGGYSELIYLPKNCVYKLPKTIASEDAIFIDDIAVAYHGVHYIDEYKMSIDNAAIIGDGPLGLLIYRVLKQQYPDKNIILFSKHLDKLEGLNINAVSYADIDDYKDYFDVILEAVGGKQSDTINKAIHIGKPNFIALFYGVFNFNFKAEVDVRTLFYKQGMLKGINSYCNKHKDFEEAISLLEEKKIVVNDLITNKVDFDKAIEFIKNYKLQKNNIKAIFVVK